MKVSIYGGEAFPVYHLYDDDDYMNVIEIDRNTFERWKRVFNEFCNVQEEIIEELNKQGHSEQVWGNDLNLRVD